jgi:hypothetical protein
MADSKPEEVPTTSETVEQNGGKSPFPRIAEIDADFVPGANEGTSTAAVEEPKQDDSKAVVESKEEVPEPAETDKQDSAKQDSTKRKGPSRFKKNIKSDFSSLAESSDHDEIRKQVRPQLPPTPLGCPAR